MVVNAVKAVTPDGATDAQNCAGPVPARRRFMQVLLGGGLLASAASFVYPILRYVIPPPATDMGGDTVVAAKVGELKANSAKIFRFGSRPGLLIYTADGEYRAMSGTCTHLSCTVQYRNDVRQAWCACHNGFYDLAGRNVSGPPPRPLEQYAVHVRGEEVVVSRKREG
jgi:cytochrome b6-f complex iron-sulfur subunit